MPNRKIIVAGGSGFIGERLVATLVTSGDEVVVLTRGTKIPRGARAARWDAKNVGEWAAELDGAYAVINLAGESVAQRWTEAAKRRILQSRLDSVQAICAAAHLAPRPPKRWINASAIGFYGDRGAEIVDESSPAGVGFNAETCVAWEAALFECPIESISRTAVRIGIVLGWGGALSTLTKLARHGLGGTVGSGDQSMSWIHLDDLIGIFQWLLDAANPPEVINGTSPNPATNREFMGILRRVVGVSFGLPTPTFLAQIVGKTVGPDADLLLSGARVRPTAALRGGCDFRFEDLEDALRNILAV